MAAVICLEIISIFISLLFLYKVLAFAFPNKIFVRTKQDLFLYHLESSHLIVLVNISLLFSPLGPISGGKHVSKSS